MLLVEHDMSLTMEISDWIVVLDQGKKIAEGTPRTVQTDETVIAAYLGTGSKNEKEGEPLRGGRLKPDGGRWNIFDRLF
ncbi:MAG: hypothetical protein R2875_11090 [Desulfobacterales bacterium]